MYQQKKLNVFPKVADFFSFHLVISTIKRESLVILRDRRLWRMRKSEKGRDSGCYMCVMDPDRGSRRPIVQDECQSIEQSGQLMKCRLVNGRQNCWNTPDNIVHIWR